MDWQTILLIITGTVTGATVALNMIASHTETLVDDHVLKVLQKVLEVLSGNRRL